MEIARKQKIDKIKHKKFDGITIDSKIVVHWAHLEE